MSNNSNSTYINDILSEYEKMRSFAEDAAKVRLNEVYEHIPRIKEIDTELGVLGAQLAQAVFKKGIDIDDFISKQKQKSEKLKAERAELLSRHNYPANYTDVIYKCKACEDTGFIGSSQCSCLKQRIIDRNYNQSNLKNILKKENFDTFVFNYYSPYSFEGEPLSPRKNIEEIVTTCINFVQNFDTSYENLFFFGNSGLGKTFLSNCIAKSLLDNGYTVMYQTASGLLDTLKEIRFSNNDDNLNTKLEIIFSCDLLIIDDLGTEYITDFSQMEIFNIINKRLLSQKKMIISTNLHLENLYKTYSERIISRLFGNFTMYKFYGDDIRLKIAENRRKAKK
mgnify:FL=1|jgi:DNA replication protein DnaC